MNEREKCPMCGSSVKAIRHCKFRREVAEAGLHYFVSDPHATCEPCAHPWHDAPQPAAEPIALSPSEVVLRDPTPNELESPLFNAIWNAIKGWDISRDSNRLYAGATGTDVCTILDAISSVSDEIRAEFTRRKATLEEEYDKEWLMRDLDEIAPCYLSPQLMRARGWYEAVVRVLEMLGEGSQ